MRLGVVLLLVLAAPTAAADVDVSTPAVPTGASQGPHGPCAQFTFARAQAHGDGVPTAEAGAYWGYLCLDLRCSDGFPLAMYPGPGGTWVAVGVSDADGDGNGDTPYARVLSTDSSGGRSPCEPEPEE